MRCFALKAEANCAKMIKGIFIYILVKYINHYKNTDKREGVKTSNEKSNEPIQTHPDIKRAFHSVTFIYGDSPVYCRKRQPRINRST